MTAKRFITAMLLVVVACSPKPAPNPRVTATEPATAALWRLAPEDSAFGVVAGDGVGTELLAVAAELERIMASRPLLRVLYPRFVNGVAQGFERELGFGLGELADLAAYGMDPGQGAAVFFDSQGEPSLAILPVSDPARFAERMKLAPETVRGRTVYREEYGVCAALGERFACAPSVAALAAPATVSPLVTLAATIPATARGGVEIAGDARRSAMLADLADEEPFRRLDAMVLAALVDRGVVETYARFDGELESVPLLDTASSAAPVARSSAGLLRVALDVARMDEATVSALATLAGVELAGLETAELSLASPLGTELGLELRVDLGGEAAIALPALCRAGAAAIPMLRDLAVEDAACRAVLDFGGFGLPPALAAIDIILAREPSALSLRVGRDVSPASVAVSPRLEPILSGGAPIAIWARSFDPLAATTPALRDAVAALMAGQGYALSGQPVSSVRWLLAHLAEAGASIRMTAEMLELHGVLVTYAADPPGVYAAYERAVGLDLDGDSDGYRRAMAALRSEHADTLAGRQAAIVEAGAPALGAGTATMLAVVAPAFVRYTRQAKASEAAANAGRLYDAARAYYAQQGTLPVPAGPTPAVGSCCEQGGACTSSPATWGAPGWAALGFAIAGEHYYSYELRVDGSTLAVRAVGDLDCDGTYATYELRGTADQPGEGGWLTDAVE